MAMADPFSEALRSPDLFEKLAANADTRQHLADKGFIEQLEKMVVMANSPEAKSADVMEAAKVGQTIARTAHNDPRIMQALMALQGQGLIVEEKDMKRAETMGDMPRREPVQLEQLQMVHGLEDADEAKAKGNELFKSGDLPAALAHYEKAVELLKRRPEVPAASLAVLLSNSALCLLKLRWPDRAKKAASQAIAAVRHAGDTTFDQSKLFYRRALACEELRELGLAADDMARALQQAKKSGQPLAEQHRLKAEIERIKKLKASDEADAERKRQEKENEIIAEAQRLQGAQMSAPKAKLTVGPQPTGDGSYLQERDFSHLALQQIAEVVKGVRHTGASGCSVETVALDEAKSKIQASITTKKGNRSLFYEMDVLVQWKGCAAPSLKLPDGPGEMTGIIRVYNIAHDTKFQLGGDANVCYMYQLGWDQRLTGPWVEDLQTEAADLFDLLAVKIDGVIRELKKK